MMRTPRTSILCVVGAAFGAASLFSHRRPVTAPPHSSSQTFIVGMLQVEHVGRSGRPPIIFIPALFCGPWQWQRQIAALVPRYDIYAVTLPGFDGRAADTAGDLVNRAVSDLSELIRARHLDRPVVVGHSLGGTLAVLFGERHPRETRGIIAVEGGYPAGPTAAVRQQRVAAAVAPYVGVSGGAFDDSLRTHMLQYVITSKAAVDSVGRLAARSAPGAVVEWMRAALLLDLTPQLGDVTAPLTEIVPFDSTVDPYQGFASEAAKRAAYTTWLTHARHGSVVMIDHSRHFVMIDQPAAFDRALFRAIDRDARPE